MKMHRRFVLSGAGKEISNGLFTFAENKLAKKSAADHAGSKNALRRQLRPEFRDIGLADHLQPKIKFKNRLQRCWQANFVLKAIYA
jgi:hypothetical protein